MKKTGFNLTDIKIEHVLELMNIYLSEWEQRDELLWQQVFKFFYATLIVSLLPNLASHFQIDLSGFPEILFPIVALFLSVVSIYMSIGYSKRLEASGKTYQKLIDLLPNELRRISISDPNIKYGKFFKYRMSITVSSLMFFALACLSIVMIIYHLKDLG